MLDEKENKRKKKPDKKYTYGYARYSVLGATITTVILLFGSLVVIVNAIDRIINPVEVNYNGMIVFAVIGVVLNFAAAYVTREGDSINQKSVNLHMLEDVLGWVVVLIGAVVMKFTDISIIDPIMSIGVAVFLDAEIDGKALRQMGIGQHIPGIPGVPSNIGSLFQQLIVHNRSSANQYAHQ